MYFFHSFIHSGYLYRASSSPLLLRGAPNYSIDTVSELTRRVGFESATLRTQGTEVTTEPPRSNVIAMLTICRCAICLCTFLSWNCWHNNNYAFRGNMIQVIQPICWTDFQWGLDGEDEEPRFPGIQFEPVTGGGNGQPRNIRRWKLSKVQRRRIHPTGYAGSENRSTTAIVNQQLKNSM